MKILKALLVVVLIGAVAVGGYLGYLFAMNGRTFAPTGDVEVRKAGSDTWEKLEKNYRLKNGDTLKTGPDSSCNILLGNTAEAVVKAGENTEVAITAKNPVELELADGKLLTNLTRDTRLKKFTVKTPVGACGIRGTGWEVSADKDNSTAEIDVFEGRVKFGQSEMLYENDPYVVPNNYRLNISKGETTQMDREKLAPEQYGKWNEWVKKSSEDLSGIGVANQMVESSPDGYPAWQEGVSYVSWLPERYSGIEAGVSLPQMIEMTNASWVNLIVTWYQEDRNTTEIKPDLEKTPLDVNLMSAIRKAQRLGAHVMLTPHVDLKYHTTGSWRGEIGYTDDVKWDEWFASYETFILYYAEIAEKSDVEILNIGTELSITTTQRPDKWMELIPKIREVYSGRLVYTANWFEEYESIRFWNLLDYAGISAYFPLSQNNKPSYFEIKRNWALWLEKIEAWQKTHGKPVIFPEIGYKSAEGAARQPWEHRSSGIVDMKLQYNCYKAAFETFWDKEWFYGMYWWAWRTDPRLGGAFDRGFSPSGKPAEKLVKAWYNKPDPHKYKSVIELAKDKLAGSRE